MSFTLLPLAVQDIAEAVTHLNKTDVRAVAPFRQAIIRSLKLIASNPNIGRHSRSDGIREWSIPGWPYLIPYRIVGADVEILRIWHTRRRQPLDWK